MFIDASALAAILLEEDDAAALSRTLEGATVRMTSAVAVYETVMAVNRVQAGGIARALSTVRTFLERARIAVVAIEDEAATGALDAQSRFGKGTGHPARLNLGDCFA